MTLLFTNVRPELVMVRGKGSELFDDTGRRYLDFVQGWAVNALGHCPEELATALAEQSRELLCPSPSFHNARALEVASALTQATGLDRVFLCNSGAEANECAVKLARKWGRLHRDGAFQVVSALGSFHGRTLAMMAASGKEGWEKKFPPNLDGFVKVPYGDVEQMARAIGEETAAILVEPIQGEAGVIVPDEGYLRALRQLADERGVLLLFDEIQTGMGRTGTLFRFQHEGVLPDILTLGKGLGGGVPVAAVVAQERAACFEPDDHGGTYCGNPLMARCAKAVFDVVQRPEFLAQVRARGNQLEAGLLELGRRRPELVKEVRGAGLLRAMGLRQPVAQEVTRRALGLGLLINAARPHTLRLMPSLRVSEAEIAEMLALLERAL